MTLMLMIQVIFCNNNDSLGSETQEMDPQSCCFHFELDDNVANKHDTNDGKENTAQDSNENNKSTEI